MRDVLAVTVLALAVAPPGHATAADQAPPAELSPPQVRWSRCGGMLRVVVTAGPEAHLADALPVEVQLSAAGHLDLSWKEPTSQPTDKVKIVLPLGSLPGDTTRKLSVSGAVCNEDGSVCLAFHANTDLPIPGPMRGTLQAQTGSSASATAERELPTRPASGPTVAGKGHALTWFHSSEQGDLELAFTSAATTARPILVDVFARWCPPCNRLRDEFLEQPDHQALLQRFVLIAADADEAGSFALKEDYQVGGYPTLLVLDPAGQLLDRIVGFPGAEQVAARLGAVAPGGAGADERQPAALAEARRLAATGQWAEAWARVDSLLQARPGAGPDRFEVLSLAVEVAPHVAAAELAHLSREAANLAPSPGRAAALAEGAAEALHEAGRGDEAAALREDFEARLAGAIGARNPAEVSISEDRSRLTGRLLRRDAGTQQDLADALWYRAGWSDGASAAHLYAEAALRSAAQVLLTDGGAPDGAEVDSGAETDQEQSIDLDLPADLLDESRGTLLAAQQGPMHDLISALNAAGLPGPAQALCRRMTAVFPEEFTWHYRLAGLQREAGDRLAAMAAARLAYHHSYGDNRLRAAARLGEILYEGGRVDEARALLERSLDDGAPEQEKVRSHRYRRRLAELLQTWHDEVRRAPR